MFGVDVNGIEWESDICSKDQLRPEAWNSDPLLLQRPMLLNNLTTKPATIPVNRFLHNPLSLPSLSRRSHHLLTQPVPKSHHHSGPATLNLIPPMSRTQIESERVTQHNFQSRSYLMDRFDPSTARSKMRYSSVHTLSTESGPILISHTIS
jgi:hypothetical protein